MDTSETATATTTMRQLLLRGIDVAFVQQQDDDDFGSCTGTGTATKANHTTIGVHNSDDNSVDDGGVATAGSFLETPPRTTTSTTGYRALWRSMSWQHRRPLSSSSPSLSQQPPTMKLWSVAGVVVLSPPSSSTVSRFATTTATTNQMAVGTLLVNDVQRDLLWNYGFGGMGQADANIDDMMPERIAFCMELLLEQGGAVDAWVTPVVMKKGRPAHTIHCLCPNDGRVDAALEALLRNSTTLGARIGSVDRATLRREIVTVQVDEWMINTVAMNDNKSDSVKRCGRTTAIRIQRWTGM